MGKAKSFGSTNLSKEIVANLESLGYLKMTPIQEQGLPYILENRDFIGQANTGSGKTAAFALGILSRLDLSDSRPQALVLCPTRELAEQVCAEIRRLARFASNIKVLVLAGGTEEKDKIKSLKQGAHIIVGTPGRLAKLLEKRDLSLSALKVLVLDEADRLLELGFNKDIDKIASCAPLDRQTLLFSATLPNGIKDLSAGLQENAAQVTIDSQHQNTTIRQWFFRVEDDAHKLDALLVVMGHYKPESSIIFCNSRAVCARVAHALKRQKIDALEIHAELDQQDRTLVLTKFANKSCCVLVATDLASRGLDVKDVQAVINYDLPSDHELYVHRIGRTGRIGKAGLALSFFAGKERYLLANIADYLKVSCEILLLDDLKQDRMFSIRPAFATIYISGGRKDNIRPGDILGALTGEAGLDSKDVGAIRILDVNSYVAVANASVDRAVERLKAGKIKGRKFKVGKA